MEWRDVIDGVAGDPRACPVALAIKRACNTPRVAIGIAGATIDGVWWDYPNNIAHYMFKVDQLAEEGYGWLARVLLGKPGPFKLEREVLG